MSRNRTLSWNSLQKKAFFSRRYIYNKINRETPIYCTRKFMNFPNYFADVESNFNEADFIIFGVPYDKTSSFRKGARYGPIDIRQASWNYEAYNMITGNDIKDIKFCDYGDIDVKNKTPRQMVKKVKELTTRILDKNKFPILLGGEHSLTSGAIQAYSNDITVLSLDAHLDYRDKHENEKYNHACVIRRISDFVDAENIFVCGVRSADKKEFEDAKMNNISIILSSEINKKGISYFLDKLYDRLKSKKIYMTLDVDVLDPSFAPGTSTPEPFGITPFDILEIIDFFSSQLVGFDVVETCPPYDNGETALIAAKLVRYVIEKASKNK